MGVSLNQWAFHSNCWEFHLFFRGYFGLLAVDVRIAAEMAGNKHVGATNAQFPASNIPVHNTVHGNSVPE